MQTENWVPLIRLLLLSEHVLGYSRSLKLIIISRAASAYSDVCHQRLQTEENKWVGGKNNWL